MSLSFHEEYRGVVFMDAGSRSAESGYCASASLGQQPTSINPNQSLWDHQEASKFNRRFWWRQRWEKKKLSAWTWITDEVIRHFQLGLASAEGIISKLSEKFSEKVITIGYLQSQILEQFWCLRWSTRSLDGWYGRVIAFLVGQKSNGWWQSSSRYE